MKKTLLTLTNVWKNIFWIFCLSIPSNAHAISLDELVKFSDQFIFHMLNHELSKEECMDHVNIILEQ